MQNESGKNQMNGNGTETEKGSWNLKNTIARIEEMEAVFDRLTAAFENDPAVVQKDMVFREELKRLTAYYESRLWMEDFQKDEQGLFPDGLKRGILSEDGIYNLLSEIGEI